MSFGLANCPGAPALNISFAQNPSVFLCPSLDFGYLGNGSRKKCIRRGCCCTPRRGITISSATGAETGNWIPKSAQNPTFSAPQQTLVCCGAVLYLERGESERREERDKPPPPAPRPRGGPPPLLRVRGPRGLKRATLQVS